MDDGMYKYGVKRGKNNETRPTAISRVLSVQSMYSQTVLSNCTLKLYSQTVLSNCKLKLYSQTVLSDCTLKLNPRTLETVVDLNGHMHKF